LRFTTVLVRDLAAVLNGLGITGLARGIDLSYHANYQLSALETS
jgi:hypothetical protein